MWNQAVVIENISGGGGNIGTDRFARSEPDGYTLLASPPGPVTFNDLLYKDIHFDARTFVPITITVKVPNVLLVRKDFPARTAAEFLKTVSDNPGKYTYASQGIASTGFLTAKLFEARTGTSMVHVPYRGAGLALSDIVAGHVDMMFDVIMTSLPLHRGNAARIIAVADDERSPALPDIPTFSEAGLPGFHSYSWFALAAPAGTPAAIVDKINKDVVAVIHQPDMDKRLRSMMFVPMGDSSAEAARFLKDEDETWTKLIKSLGVKPE
jgi:tripartite-type tricarboxylate transporter receptor subunit TctC